MNSKEENYLDFCLDFVQEFGLIIDANCDAPEKTPRKTECLELLLERS